MITALELEHTDILGPTIEEIARNKGGIIKPGVPVVVSLQPQAALMVLEEIAARNEAPLLLSGRDWRWIDTAGGFTFEFGDTRIESLDIVMPGRHQRENAATAIAAVMLLRGDDLPPPEAAIREGLRRTTLPGRFEVVRHAGREVVLDGAHTAASISMLVESLAERGINDPVVIAGFLRDKDLPALIGILASSAKALYLTSLNSPRTATVDDISAALQETPSRNAAVVANVDEAWSIVFDAREAVSPVVVTGSMTLVAHARERLDLAPGED